MAREEPPAPAQPGEATAPERPRDARYSTANGAQRGRDHLRATGPCLVPDRATPDKREPDSADVPRE